MSFTEVAKGGFISEGIFILVQSLKKCVKFQITFQIQYPTIYFKFLHVK